MEKKYLTKILRRIKKTFRNAFENFELKKNPGSTYKEHIMSLLSLYDATSILKCFTYLLMWAKTMRHWFFFSEYQNEYSLLCYCACYCSVRTDCD